MRPVRGRRRRPPHRLERHRAHRHDARPRRAGRARARRPGSSSTRRPRWPSAPPSGARPTSPRASRSRSATSPRGAATGSASSRSGPTTWSGAGRARAGAACCSRSAALREDPDGQRLARRGAARSSTGSPSSARSSSIVSDFRGPIDWHKPLLRVAGRHPTVAVEIRDPREQELADVGELRLVDPETGRQLRVDTSSARLRERFAAAAAEEREGLVRLLSSAGVRHVALSTEGDWLRPLAAFLKRSATRCADRASRRPWLLLFLLLVPLAIGGYFLLERRRARPRASAGRRAALMPNMVPSRPGLPPLRPARALPDRARAAARRLRAAAGEDRRAARGRDGRAGDRHLGLDGREGRRQPDGSGRTTRLLAARDAVSDFLDKLPDKYRVSLVTFGNRGSVQGAADLRPRQGR